MKYFEALEIIQSKKEDRGYRVRFETPQTGYSPDWFPNLEEPSIPEEETAWDLARMFAIAATEDNAVNVYVVHAESHKPVAGYRNRMFNRL